MTRFSVHFREVCSGVLTKDWSPITFTELLFNQCTC